GIDGGGLKMSTPAPEHAPKPTSPSARVRAATPAGVASTTREQEVAASQAARRLVASRGDRVGRQHPAFESSAAVLALQRTIGNQAVGRLIARQHGATVVQRALDLVVLKKQLTVGSRVLGGTMSRVVALVEK